MSSLQVGSRRSAGVGSAMWVYAVILAIVVAAAAVYVLATGGVRYSPPNTTGAPATNAPATYAPGAPATNMPVPTVPGYP